MKVYTKTGDKGKTSLLGGKRVDKDDERLEAYGAVDELNSFIGAVHDLDETTAQYKDQLREIQCRLFDIGALLAADKEIKAKYQLRDICREDIESLERRIDCMQELLPTQDRFILPSGHRAVSAAHIARSVCRRAERRVSSLHRNISYEHYDMVIVYLNRLSDYLFVLARTLARLTGAKENYWE